MSVLIRFARPRDSLRRTIEMTIDRAWPHRFVLREACDLWTAVPEVRDAWLDVINAATIRTKEPSPGNAS